jgi:hypothetical protein
MSDNEKQQLRIKVAELCGLRVGSTGFDQHSRQIPDYPNDLNACAEFKKTMTPDQRYRYCNILSNECGTGATDYHIFATAEQRCLAFVATMKGASVL